MRVFKKWSVAIIGVRLVPMLYCSAWLRQWMLAQVLDWFTQICLALKHVHDHRSVSAQSRMRSRMPSRMRSRICESCGAHWEGLIDNATLCQCCNRVAPWIGRAVLVTAHSALPTVYRLSDATV